MEIPNEKHKASPITGASSRKTDGAAGRPPLNPDEDILIGDEVFETPVISLPPRIGPKEPPQVVLRDLTPPPDTKEVEPKSPRKQPLERRTAGPAPHFKRLIRPETALAAHTAASQARAESPVDMGKVDRDSMQFGKIHPHASPDYRPNRLFRVLDSIYTNSPLKWLDFVEQTGARFIVGGIILCIIGGFVGWRYFASLAERESSSTVAKPAVVSTEERVERGKKTVQEFLGAQTIEARLPLVLDPDRAGPRMRQFYETVKGEDPKVVSWEVGAPVTSEHGTWMPFTFQDNTGHKVTIVLGESETGCRVDWENFTAFGDILWPEFCRTRPSAPKAMRVRLRPTEKYEGSYTKATYQAYEVEHRSGGPRLLGYAGRTGRTAQALAELGKGGQWQAAQLYLRFESAGGGNNLVVIDDVVRSRWQDEQTSWTAP